ncbi:hypothetical protein AAH091_04575, partial [Candidatus Bacteroides intestinigallinarum]
NRMYGGVRGRKAKVGRKLLRFPPTRFSLYIALILPIFGYFPSLGTVLSFPLHSLSPLANPSCENLVVLASSQFQQAGCGYTHVLLML